MIEVNLLPNEYRKVEKTPLPIFLALLGCVVIVLGVIIGYIYFHFRIVPDVKIEYQKLDKLEKDVRDLENKKRILNDEITGYQARLSKLLMVMENKILWSEKIYLLSSHIKRDETGIWFEDMKMKQTDIFAERNDLLKKVRAKKAAEKDQVKKNKPMREERNLEVPGTFVVSCKQKFSLDEKKILDFKDWLLKDRKFILCFNNKIEMPQYIAKEEALAVPEDRKIRVFDLTFSLLPVKVVVEE
jgi:hypothetical protein